MRAHSTRTALHLHAVSDDARSDRSLAAELDEGKVYPDLGVAAATAPHDDGDGVPMAMPVLPDHLPHAAAAAVAVAEAADPSAAEWWSVLGQWAEEAAAVNTGGGVPLWKEYGTF